MVCTLNEDKNDINMFKTQVEPRTENRVISLQSFDNFDVAFIVVDLFFYNNIESFNVHFRWSFSKN